MISSWQPKYELDEANHISYFYHCCKLIIISDLKVLEQLPGTLARLEADVAALRKAVEGDRRILDVSL